MPHLQLADRALAGGAARPAPPVLIVPGIDNSGPAHWQTLWQGDLADTERAEQSDWFTPTLAEWTAGLVEAIRRRPGSILVAHSLGCALVAHVAQVTGGRGVAGALLVAPADVDERARTGRLAPGFAPMPMQALPFPTVVVASRDDPYVTIERARAFAAAWGAGLVDIGLSGHINADSGHGAWPEGRAILAALSARVQAGP